MENIKSIIEVWEKAKDLIKSKVNPQTFETWFKPTKGLEISKGCLVLEVPNSFFKDWLLEHHLDLIKSTLKDIAGGPPAFNAQVIRDIFSGTERGPRRDFLVLNNAAALYVSGKARSIGDGIELSRSLIDSGAARRKLQELAEKSHAA